MSDTKRKMICQGPLDTEEKRSTAVKRLRNMNKTSMMFNSNDLADNLYVDSQSPCLDLHDKRQITLDSTG